MCPLQALVFQGFFAAAINILMKQTRQAYLPLSILYYLDVYGLEGVSNSRDGKNKVLTETR